MTRIRQPRPRRHAPTDRLPALLLVATLAAAGAAPLAAQTPAGSPVDAAPGSTVRYDVSFPDAVHHQVRVKVTFSDLGAGQPLEALMSRASPGRYALHEFAKNVYDVSAVDGAGDTLTLRHPTPHEWDAVGHDGTVSISYTVFADHADGTYAGVDSTHAHFNMPAAFMYARGLEMRPIRVTFRPIHGWKVATQLQRTDDPNTFEAPHLQYFMDSPTELSDYTLREWHVGPGGKLTYRIALHTEGATPEQVDHYADMARRVVAEEAGVFGEYPQFDYGTYTFLADYLPWVFGDGMEHRNSTIISNSRTLPDNELRLLGTLAHEHFHSWNMERLRSAGIEPFRFDRANMSGDLWFGEGFTSYYDGLVRVRAGFTPLADWAGDLAGTLNYVIGSPARRFRAPVQMSELAPFVDAAVSIDQTDFGNTFISYYSWGEVLGLGLDLTLREKFGLSLDDYMRAMWREFGRYQENATPQRPYTHADLRRVLGQVTGDTAFAGDFFRRYVDGRDVIDYASLLLPAGLLLRPARPDQGVLSPLALRPTGGHGAVVAQPVPLGTAAYDAGLAFGDTLVSIDGTPIDSHDDVAAALKGKAPGERVSLVFRQTGAGRTRQATLQADPTLELVLFEAAGRQITPAIRAFRAAWLGSHALGRQ